MTEDNNEVMDIAQEECAEVIQAISKIRRFGMDNAKPGTEYTNREHLEEELGDVLAMVDILLINGVVKWGNLHKAKRAKIEKLKNFIPLLNLMAQIYNIFSIYFFFISFSISSLLFMCFRHQDKRVSSFS